MTAANTSHHAVSTAAPPWGPNVNYRASTVKRSQCSARSACVISATREVAVTTSALLTAPVLTRFAPVKWATKGWCAAS